MGFLKPSPERQGLARNTEAWRRCTFNTLLGSFVVLAVSVAGGWFASGVSSKPGPRMGDKPAEDCLTPDKINKMVDQRGRWVVKAATITVRQLCPGVDPARVDSEFIDPPTSADSSRQLAGAR